MRIELERQELRKKDQDPVRQLELACIFTLCGMKIEHKFLAYKSAFTLNYKAGNFITASHFARQVIDLESSGVSFLSQSTIINKSIPADVCLAANELQNSHLVSNFCPYILTDRQR